MEVVRWYSPVKKIKNKGNRLRKKWVGNKRNHRLTDLARYSNNFPSCQQANCGLLVLGNAFFSVCSTLAGLKLPHLAAAFVATTTAKIGCWRASVASTDILKIKRNRRCGSVCMRFVYVVAVGKGGGAFCTSKTTIYIQRRRKYTEVTYNGTWSSPGVKTRQPG